MNINETDRTNPLVIEFHDMTQTVQTTVVSFISNYILFAIATIVCIIGYGCFSQYIGQWILFWEFSVIALAYTIAIGIKFYQCYKKCSIAESVSILYGNEFSHKYVNLEKIYGYTHHFYSISGKIEILRFMVYCGYMLYGLCLVGAIIHWIV